MTQIITNTNGGGGGGGGGEGDMKKSVYDPQNIGKDAFDYDNFTNTPTIPTVNNATLTIQKNSTDVATFTANASSNVTANISVPTDTGDLTNGAGYVTSSIISNNAYGGAWNGDTTHAPTKDALYDKIHTMDVEIGNKAADTTVVKLTGNQTIAGTKTFSTSPVVPSKSTAATNSDTAIATEAQVKLVADDVATINGKIPSAATSSNQLADKDYVNDGINSVTAYYITKNAQGDQWATRAELFAATTFYSGGVVRVPTKNDYTIVLADENHDNATTRYIYNSGWEYQYTVNETAMTQAQLDALNSGITSGKVSTYDGYATTIAGKQNALATQTAYTTKGTSTKVPTISTNTLGQVTAITETSISFPVTSVNGNTGAVTVSEVPSGGNNGDVLTNVSGTPTWSAPSGGLQVAPNSPITGIKYVWYGTEADYANLSQYYTDTPGDTEYHTF